MGYALCKPFHLECTRCCADDPGINDVPAIISAYATIKPHACAGTFSWRYYSHFKHQKYQAS